MNSDRVALDAAYRRTRYVVAREGGNAVVRTDRTSPELDALLRELGLETWVIVSAFNPFSKGLSPEENEKRHAGLLAEVVRHGWPFRQASGEPAPEDGWRPEKSLFVAGVGREKAAALGAKFGQNAVVFGRAGEAAELLWLV